MSSDPVGAGDGGSELAGGKLVLDHPAPAPTPTAVTRSITTS
jgi:hypothetical protein